MNVRIALSAAVTTALAAAAGPSFAAASGPTHTQVKGTIASISSKFDFEVQQKNGGYVPVHMHQGTIINPTGLTLQSGMQVTVLGISRGNAIAANEVNTPYHYTQQQYAPAPLYPYGAYNGFGPGIYGAPIYGYGFPY